MTPEEELEMLQLEEEELTLQQQQTEMEAQFDKRPWEQVEPSPPESFGGKVALGMGTSAVETALGAKDLFTDLSQEEKDTLGSMRRDVKASGFGGGLGSAVGELAQLAVPASKLSKAKALQRGTKLGRPGLLAAETGLAAAHGGTKYPREGKSRFDEAVESGAWAMAGGAAGEGIGKLFRGANVTPEAKRLMAEGVELTGGKASQGALPKVLELAASINPITGGNVAKQREKAVQQAQEFLFDKARPFSANFLDSNIIPKDSAGKFGKVTATGQEGVTQLNKMVDDAYDIAWQKAGTPSITDMVKLSEDIDVLKGAVEGIDIYKLPLRRIDDAINVYANSPTPGNLRRIGQMIKGGKDKAWDAADETAARTYERISDRFTETLSREGQDILNEINKNYGSFKAIQNAMARQKPSETGVMQGKDVLAGAKAVGGKSRQAKGTSPLFQFGQDMARTLDVKDADPLMLTSAAQKLSKFGPGFIPSGVRATIGETGTQKRMTELAKALRSIGIDPATISTAIQ